MANTPRKVQDPTEAALSAIQDALSLREGEPSVSADAPILGPQWLQCAQELRIAGEEVVDVCLGGFGPRP